MSKIQKALDQIRDGRSKAPSPESAGLDRRKLRNKSYAVPGSQLTDEQQSNLQAPPSREEVLASERLPSEILHVDLQTLRDANLYPDEDNIDDVAQQLRRIKRPVINIAFGEGQPKCENANMIMLASAMPKSVPSTPRIAVSRMMISQR